MSYVSPKTPPMFKPIYALENVENVNYYQPGGLHPISIGDCFDQGRYKVIHKLGHGVSSTVWLVRDHEGKHPGRLVALKAFVSSASDTRTELTILEYLKDANPPISGILPVHSRFTVDGPNGSHLFVALPRTGPTIHAMSQCPGHGFGLERREGSRWLRAGLARKVTKQLVMTVDKLHRAGVVHGDITPRNVMFVLKPHILRWTDDEVYHAVGKPKSAKMSTIDGTPLPLGAPAELIGPLDYTPLTFPSYLEESVILADFGSSYIANNKPNDYIPATLMDYFAPEARFEQRTSFEADVWELGCAIFEICAGRALFANYFNNESDLLMETVATLGRLPDPWWGQFEERSRWFTEDGESVMIKNRNGVGFKPAIRMSSIREELRSIGACDRAPLVDEGPMIANTGVRLSEEEVELLGDLLEKMLRYIPEERIGLQEVMNHPWFAMSE